MISEISFSKLTRDETKKLTWLTALWFLLFFFLIPFRSLLALTIRNAESAWYEAEAPLNTLAGQMGFGHIENTVFILGAGIFCALTAFSYVQSQVRLDFYHSLALRRETLFAVKYLAGLLTFALPYVICQALGLLAGLPYGAVSGKLVLETAAASFQGILFFLVSYSTTLVAVMLTGKWITSVFCLIIFVAYLPCLVVTEMGYRNVFFFTDLLSRNGILNELIPLNYSSPWVICGSMNVKRDAAMRAGLTGCWPLLEDLCQLFALAALLTAIALFLYRIRRTEAAGSALAFPRTEGVIKVLLAVPCALLAGLAGYSIQANTVWGVAFTAGAGILICAILEFIYRWDIRQALMHKSQILLTVVISLCLFLGGKYDAQKYNAYLPPEEEVEAMAVSNFWTDYSYEIEPGVWERSANLSQKARLELFLTEEFAPLYRMAENGVERAESAEIFLYGDGDEQVVPVDIKYELKNGKNVYRFYYVDADAYYDCMNELWSSQKFREQYCPILTMDPEAFQTLEYQWNSQDLETSVVASGEEISRLLEAYRKDMSRLSYEEIYPDYSGSYTYEECGNLVTNRGASFPYNDYYPLNTGFVNTLEVLKELEQE